CQHYEMIREGDKIAVGISGGKDSLALLLALSRMRDFYPVKYDVCALSIDMGFSGSEGLFDPVSEFCASLGVEYRIERTEIAQIVFNERKEKNPCSLCAMMRRGALVNASKEMGATAIALGHHLDDAVETFMLSLTNEGRIGCFSPVTVYENSGINVIRPLVYAREYEVASVARAENLPVVKSPCPEDGETERERMKEYLRSLDREHRGVYLRILGAMERRGIDGWRE
ncbi:MAG: ATP-binding protein, partial [bacterium]|nr:ATP-binding protein [bacterium]